MADQSPTSMSAAAQAYQESLHKYQPRADSANPQPSPAPPPPTDVMPDTAMRDAPPVSAQSPQAMVAISPRANIICKSIDLSSLQQSPAPATLSTTSTPAPARTATPSRTTNGIAEVPKAEPEVIPIPTKPVPHGAPARRYLNEKVTGVLLEGMKKLAKEQPKDPLRVLGEHLLQRSKELEGT
ncbi:MAG: hypothetical protein M1836_004155 [Candelina mexicana]|nr:MAG: hypothetical protein M1836_004155 [Candelina mexicana]